MILWFGKKKKQDEARAAGAAMVAPELSADEIAAREAETATKQAEKAEIERVVAEANKAWEERQVREAAEAEAEARRLDDEARRAETARAEALSRADESEARRLEAEAEAARLAREEREAARAKAAGELKLLEDRREAARLREEREAAARAALEAEANDPGFVARLGSGLARSSSRLGTGLAAFNKRRLDDETLEDLEDLLITSDLGAAVAQRVTRNLSKERFDREITENEIKLALAAEIESVLAPREQIVDFSDGPRPRVVMFAQPPLSS